MTLILLSIIIIALVAYSPIIFLGILDWWEEFGFGGIPKELIIVLIFIFILVITA